MLSLMPAGPNRASSAVSRLVSVGLAAQSRRSVPFQPVEALTWATLAAASDGLYFTSGIDLS